MCAYTCEGGGGVPAVKIALRWLAATVLSALCASAASACPACMSADPKTAGTYLGMTLMMSGLPLGMISGLAYLLWRRY